MSNTNSLYNRLGGEVVIREFVNHLYDYMDSTPEVKHVRGLHSMSLSYASDRLFMFLSGMLGGPPLYMNEVGPPRLRQRHLHFEIGNEERDQWLMCAQYAANQLNIDNYLREELIRDLTIMANHLRNTGENTNPCINKRTAS